MNPFEQFRRLLPLTDLQIEADAIRRKFSSVVTARHFEQLACEIIMANALPLVACVEIWERKGVAFEINLVVEMAPEEYAFSDEAGDDEGLTGGWYTTKSE